MGVPSNYDVACEEILFGACCRRIFNGLVAKSPIGRPLLDAWRSLHKQLLCILLKWQPLMSLCMPNESPIS